MNTALHLLYRDGNNFKVSRTVVLDGAPPGGIVAFFDTVYELLEPEDGHVVPEQVGLPPIYPWMEGEAAATTADHGWVEIHDIDLVEEPPTVDLTPGAFLDRVRQADAEGWAPPDPYEHMLDHLEHVVEAMRDHRATQGAFYRQMVGEGRLTQAMLDRTLAEQTPFEDLAEAGAVVGRFPDTIDWSDLDIDWRGLFETLVEHRPMDALRLLLHGPASCVDTFTADDVRPFLEHDHSEVRGLGQRVLARIGRDVERGRSGR